jgi:hypothetical protein
LQYWNRGLTEAEATNAMWLPGSVPQNLQVWIPFWGVDSPEQDLSGNNRDATLFNSPASNSGGGPYMMGGGLPL